MDKCPRCGIGLHHEVEFCIDTLKSRVKELEQDLKDERNDCVQDQEYIKKLLAENNKLRLVVAASINVDKEMDVFLGVSQKIHFPDARDASAKLKEALRELDEKNK